jgi:hypothetical protein
VSGSALIDTGAILALLNGTDRWHRACVDAFRQLRLPLRTSEAVLTELFHLVGDDRREVEAAWKFVRSGVLGVDAGPDIECPVTRIAQWISPTPPWFILPTIFTMDRADFNTYRIDGRRRFRVLPVNRT